MREILGKYRVAIVAMCLLALLCVFSGYVIGSDNMDARVGYGEFTVSLGDGSGDNDTKIIPMGEAIAAIYQRTETMEGDVQFLLDYTHREMVRNVENQYNILRNDPAEAHHEEILKVLDDWGMIPVSMRSTDLAMKYKFVSDWHEQTIHESAYVAHQPAPKV